MTQSSKNDLRNKSGQPTTALSNMEYSSENVQNNERNSYTIKMQQEFKIKLKNRIYCACEGFRFYYLVRMY